MRRGDIVVVALQGDSGKPRPAVVVQAEQFAELSSVVILPLTATLLGAELFRVNIEPAGGTGLHTRSQIAVDRPNAVRREKIGRTIGRADDATMVEVNRSLAVFLGLA
jgi:mRNA interferase MazF